MNVRSVKKAFLSNNIYNFCVYFKNDIVTFFFLYNTQLSYIEDSFHNFYICSIYIWILVPHHTNINIYINSNVSVLFYIYIYMYILYCDYMYIMYLGLLRIIICLYLYYYMCIEYAFKWKYYWNFIFFLVFYE